MPAYLDIEPRIPEDFSQKVAEGVKAGIRQALVEIGADLSLTEDERHVLDRYRERQTELRGAAQKLVVDILAEGERQTYNVTR